MKIASTKTLPKTGSKGFSLAVDGQQMEIFIVCQNGIYLAYLNQCPHTGIGLNWKPDEFLDLDGTLIQCSTHGARFRISDGYCISGPCIGLSLKPITLQKSDNQISILLDEPE